MRPFKRMWTSAVNVFWLTKQFNFSQIFYHFLFGNSLQSRVGLPVQPFFSETRNNNRQIVFCENRFSVIFKYVIYGVFTRGDRRDRSHVCLHGAIGRAIDRGDRSRDRSPRRSPRVNTLLRNSIFNSNYVIKRHLVTLLMMLIKFASNLVSN